MRGSLKVALVLAAIIVSAGACDKQAEGSEADDGFDADEYVEEEFRDFFEVEEKAGAARRLSELPSLPNVA